MTVPIRSRRERSSLLRTPVLSRASTAFVLICTAGCAEDPTGPVPPAFEIVDLGAFGPCDNLDTCRSEAVDVNDAGQVAGTLPGAPTDWEGSGFVWQAGSVTGLGGGGIYDINNLGQVVGRNGVWTTGQWRRLEPLEPTAISDAGHVVGTVFYPDVDEDGNPIGETLAVLRRSGTDSILGSLGGFALPIAVSDSGHVVGWSGTGLTDWDQGGTQEHAFLWKDGVMTDLGTLGGWSSFAQDVNNHGQVVGWSETRTASYSTAASPHAFLWQNGVMTDLGTLGGDLSYAYGINEAGDIVGGSLTVDGSYHAVLWRNGEMIDLGTLDGYAVSHAYKINEAGMIAGYSEAPRARRATLWRPK